MRKTHQRGTEKTLHKGPSLWYALPALLLFGLFAAIPLVGVVILSLTNWDGLGAVTWNGIGNWIRMLHDPLVLNGLKLTVILTVVSWLVQTPICILLGVFMAGKQRYRAFLSVFYFIPLLFSSTAVAIAFKNLLDPQFGLGKALGWKWLAHNWLGDPNTALWTLIVVVSWCFIPLHSLLYQGAVRQIPQSLYEAAMLDGAGTVRQFFSITLPQIKYTFATDSTLMIVGSLTYFDLVYVMTAGGPGNATRILPLDMYLKGFKSYDMGGASVVGVIILVMGIAISLLLNKLSGSDKMESQMEGV
ncbi:MULTISPECIES: carbohydrate ABC transporter permease [Bifidobacterium]|uniref:Sugar ABC transporter permease n=1 Tax=Bifidobacterium polysaccharolyticum TaxID=2750967 RepID=A0ABS0QUU5_9BIFI|nr:MULTISPECIES: sugar ABC transporter permease [Bifidobacterium]PXY82012.1 ABC transporter [Bifidobacterium asteroides]MBI0064371.1 sugar ABC transporter permease [Bifidobacterium polysaccharolyticum]MBI0105660.1 sugar ABC transporter permease [Bifidobacterium polysaccharolyticum]MBI0145695.1 sugar ABC transporter permease [Bifidobacterium polysaccharolyticum]MBI0152834.1 sugar ABC transporter permease [Bifidobacterium sp. M0399]